MSRFHAMAATSFGLWLGLSSAAIFADEVGPLTTFVAKTPAKAADVNENFNAVKNAVNGSHAKIQALAGTVTTQGNDLTTLGNSIAGHTTTIYALGATATTHGTDIATLKTENGNQTTSINSLITTVNGHTTSINAITSSVTNHTGSISNLDTDNTTNKNDIASLKSRATKLETNTATTQCPSDMVPNGPSCIDKYEASVWETTDASLIAKIKGGTATKVDLTAAVQHGAMADDYGSGCPDTANGCKTFAAASIPGVTPARYVTWFSGGCRLPQCR